MSSLRRKPFLFVDGEGGDEPDGSHSYMVICGWSEHTGPLTLRNPDDTPLSTEQILDWLLDLGQRLTDEHAPHHIVGFGLEYDKAMWLKGLPERIANRLYRPEIVGWMDPKRRVPKPVVWGPYMFHRLGSELSITETTFGMFARKTDRKACQSVKVWDIWRFFQGSFVRALDQWKILPPEELAMMEKMKARRSTFAADRIDQEIIDYCLSECRAGVALMTRLDDTCRELGFPLKRFDGAGSLASAMLDQWEIKQYQAPPPAELVDPVSRAYFGGRFENSAHGRIDRPLWQYDICSAYPHIIRDLPCLACGTWEPTTEVHPDGIYEVKWDLDGGVVWGGLPSRDHRGVITFPRRGHGWYWGAEVAAAIRTHPEGIEVLSGQRYIRSCDHVPFRHLEAVYRQRKALGKSAKGIVLKLGLNSLYGKCAQTVGNPRYGNYIWAGMITAGCRAMLLDAIRTAPDPSCIVSTATDAVVSTVPLPLDLGDQLGQWEETHIDGGCLAIQPGVMIAYTAGKGKYKTRGIANKVFAGVAHVAEQRWEDLGLFGEFTAKSNRFLGLKGALAQNNYDTRCRWVELEQSLGFMPVTKREIPPDQLTAHLHDDYARSVTVNGDGQLSAVYERIKLKLTLELFGDEDEYEVPAEECERTEVTAA